MKSIKTGKQWKPIQRYWLITPGKICEWGWLYFNIHFILAGKAGVRLHTGKFPLKE